MKVRAVPEFIRIFSACAAEWVDPFGRRNAKSLRGGGRGKDDRGGEVYGVEGVHEEGICML